jgi:hypothetical protein
MQICGCRYVDKELVEKECWGAGENYLGDAKPDALEVCFAQSRRDSLFLTVDALAMHSSSNNNTDYLRTWSFLANFPVHL